MHLDDWIKTPLFKRQFSHFTMAWAPRLLHSQVLEYLNRNSSSKYKAESPRASLQKGGMRTQGLISLTSLVLLFTGCSQLPRSPGQCQLPQLWPEQCIFCLVTRSDLAITRYTHSPFLIQLLCYAMRSVWTTISPFVQGPAVHHAKTLIWDDFPVIAP